MLIYNFVLRFRLAALARRGRLLLLLRFAFRLFCRAALGLALTASRASFNGLTKARAGDSPCIGLAVPRAAGAAARGDQRCIAPGRLTTLAWRWIGGGRRRTRNISLACASCFSRSAR